MDNLTRYLVAALLLVWSTPNFVLGQVIMTGHHRLIGTSVPVCPPPSGLTSLWAARNPSNTCFIGNVTCTNGANIESVADAGSAGNVLTPSSTIAPTYTTGAIGTNPAFTFVSANQTLLQLTSQFDPTATTQAMFVAVLEPGASNVFSILNSGATSSINCLNSLAWYMNNGVSTVDACFIANVFIDSGHNYSGVWAEVYFTINFSTGAYTFGHCGASVGCVQDGSGSSPQGWARPSNTIGGQIYSGTYANGPMAEFDYNTTGSTTGLATYLACQYPTI